MPTNVPQQGASSAKTQRFHYISADLVSASECARVIAEATALNDGAPPDIVWCCAGSSHPTLFIDTPVEQIPAQMDSNYFSSAYVAHAALRAWLKPADDDRPAAPTAQHSKPAPPEPRHLIFTSSFLGLYTIAGYAPYSPSKAALRSLSDTLSQETKLYEAAYPHRPAVRLHTVFPATIFTESYEAESRLKSDLTKKLEEDDSGQTADECARASIAGLERGDELVTTTWLTRLVMGTVLGGSLRNWFWVGLMDTVVAWIMALVMVFVRWDMDRKVMRWGREHGPSGMKRSSERVLSDEGKKK